MLCWMWRNAKQTFHLLHYSWKFFEKKARNSNRSLTYSPLSPSCMLHYILRCTVLVWRKSFVKIWVFSISRNAAVDAVLMEWQEGETFYNLNLFIWKEKVGFASRMSFSCSHDIQDFLFHNPQSHCMLKKQ